MIASKVFETLQPYLEVIDLAFDPNWYRPKSGYVIILSATRSVPLYLESVTVEKTEIRFGTNDVLERDEPDLHTYDLNAVVYLDLKVYKLGEPVAEIAEAV